jgi:hypothetical protein
MFCSVSVLGQAASMMSLEVTVACNCDCQESQARASVVLLDLFVDGNYAFL